MKGEYASENADSMKDIMVTPSIIMNNLANEYREMAYKNLYDELPAIFVEILAQIEDRAKDGYYSCNIELKDYFETSLISPVLAKWVCEKLESHGFWIEKRRATYRFPRLYIRVRWDKKPWWYNKFMIHRWFE